MVEETKQAISNEYLAGYFEGRGTIIISTWTKKPKENTRCSYTRITPKIHLSVDILNKEMEDKIKEITGGKYYFRAKPERRKPFFDIISLSAVSGFILAVADNLIFRKEQTKRMLEFIESRKSHKNRTYTKREQILAREIVLLNKNVPLPTKHE